MTNDGLAPAVTPEGSEEPPVTKLQTWVANRMTVPFNFSKETQFMEAYKKKRQGANTLDDVLNTDSILHKDVCLELEVRDSDFIEIMSRGHLESCFVRVSLDRASIVDCLMAKDLSKEA